MNSPREEKKMKEHKFSRLCGMDVSNANLFHHQLSTAIRWSEGSDILNRPLNQMQC